MNLKPETEERVARLVATGRFQNADEVVSMALEMVKSDDLFTTDFVSRNREYLEGALESAQQEPAHLMTDRDWRELHRRVEERANS